MTKFYDDDWMLQYGFLERPEVIRVEEVLAAKHGEVPPLVSIGAHQKVRQGIDLLQEFGISQAPVVREDNNEVSSFVGSIRSTRSSWLKKFSKTNLTTNKRTWL